MRSWENIEPSRKYFYKEVNGVKLPMHVYIPDVEITKETLVVIAIHGGAWETGILDNRAWNGCSLRSQVKYYASKGAIGIEISYRSINLSKEITPYDLIEDCEDAMKYIKDNLKLVDHRIVVFGDSAGGHLATMLGISQNDQIRPYAVVACNPVINCYDFMKAFKGKDCRNACPNSYEPQKCSKFLFLHGLSDVVVDYRHTEEMNNKLQKLGHSSDLILLPYTKHAFIVFDYQSSDSFILNIMRQIDTYMAEKWF